MIKKLLATFVGACLLVSCDSESSNKEHWVEESEVRIESISISGVDKEEAVKMSRTINLSVSGMRNVVVISSNVNEMDVSGTENQITVLDGVSIKDIDVSGIDNLLSLPANFQTDLNSSGIRNEIAYRD